MKSLMLKVVATLLISSPVFGDPVGETMSYTLNKSRSHRLIKAGIVNHSVKEDAGDVYNTEMYCRFDVTLLGRKEGTGTMPFPKETFDPQWIEFLRSGGEYTGPGYKVVHIGYGTARAADGTVFENCDKLKIFDVDTSNACIQTMLQSVSTNNVVSADSSVEMIAHVKSGYPILGFVQLDLVLINGSSRYDVGLDLNNP